MPSFWLPYDARDNGLSAPAWAAIADVEPARAESLLDSLAARQVPACAAPLHDWSGLIRIFVDSTRHARAENVLLSELYRPAPAAPPSSDEGDPSPRRLFRHWWRRASEHRQS
jgi:hypothetical protein